MTELREDALSGDLVFVTPQRQARPNLPSANCPFCPGGLEAPDPYEVRWFANRWPALPGGRSEVVLYTPEHDSSFARLADGQAAAVVELWAARTEALGRRDDVDYVLVFENRGAEVGATISHPHGQIYAFDFVPPAPLSELRAGTKCALCTEDPGPRLVAAIGGWRAWVPAAAAWPYALIIGPDDHLPDLPAARPSAMDLARLLTDVFARLDRLFGDPMPYMWWWHQRPTDGGRWDNAHVHAHVAPLLRSPGTPRFVAAGELGSGVLFNPVAPEDAAARLRET